jgi:hypothetical protein
MLFFSNDRTWGRKLRESGTALMLETQYSKGQILEAYLNAVYMGHDADVAIYGIGAASRYFLGKDLAEVRLDEAALLAAAIQAPNRTFLGRFPRAVQARRNRILQAMRDLGTTGETAVREAVVSPLPRRPAGSAAQEAYFVDLAREEIARRVSLPASGEVRIATTLDPLLQRRRTRAPGGSERIERSRRSSGGVCRRLWPSAGLEVRALVAAGCTARVRSTARRGPLASPVRSSSLLCIWRPSRPSGRVEAHASRRPRWFSMIRSRFWSAPVPGCRRTSTVGSAGR